MSNERLTDPLLSRQTPEHNEFLISAQTLLSLFDPKQIRDGQSQRTIVELGGLAGLMSTLQTSESSGITSSTLKSRVSQYGSNTQSNTPFTPKFQYLPSPIVMNFIIGSIVLLSILVLTRFHEFSFKVAGIFGAIILLIIIGVALAYLGQKISIRTLSKNIKVTRDGKVITLSVLDLAVGDVLFLEAGDDMPVDAIIINSSNLCVNESIVTGKVGLVQKGNNENQDPFLFDGSQITQGYAYALALAVGLNTYKEINIKYQIKLSEKSAPLQVQTRKFIRMQKHIGKIAGVLILVSLLISILINSKSRGWNIDDATQIANVIFISLIFVLFYYDTTIVNNFSPLSYVDQFNVTPNLIKSISSIESLGQVTCICSELTGVLLDKNMRVLELYAQGKGILNCSSDNLKPIIKDLLVYLFCLNTNVTFLVNENGGTSLSGDRMQIAMIRLAESWGFRYDSTRNSHQILYQFPFNSVTKRIGTVAKINDKVYFFVSDSSTTILNQCKFRFNKSGDIDDLSEEKKLKLRNIFIKTWKSQGYRNSIFAYKELTEYEEFLNNPELKLEDLEKDLVLLGIASIGEPLINEVEKTISTCKEAGITIMIITGQNKDLAINTAKQCGVLPIDYTFSAGDDKVLTGQEFQTRVKGLIEDPNNPNERVVNDIAEFSALMSKMRVMVRANPEVKELLVTGLRQLNEVVAFAGCENSDAPALLKSNVGFSMGSTGSQLAHDASDIILLDDRFSSILTAILLGRNIYHTLSRYIQPQIITSVMLVLCTVFSLIIEQTPLIFFQIYWIMFFINVLGANFLASLRQTIESAIKNSPRSYKKLITLDMKRNMIGQIIYQTTVLCFILFLLPEYSIDLFGKKIRNQIDSEKWQIDKGVHFTIFFNCFVLMQLFNLINCNGFKSSKLNVLKGLFNGYFMIVIIVIAIIQFLVMIYGARFLNCSKLTIEQNIFCWVVGAGSLIFGVLFRLLPLRICSLCGVSSSSINIESKSKCSELFCPDS